MRFIRSLHSYGPSTPAIQTSESRIHWSVVPAHACCNTPWPLVQDDWSNPFLPSPSLVPQCLYVQRRRMGIFERSRTPCACITQPQPRACLPVTLTRAGATHGCGCIYNAIRFLRKTLPWHNYTRICQNFGYSTCRAARARQQCQCIRTRQNAKLHPQQVQYGSSWYFLYQQSHINSPHIPSNTWFTARPSALRTLPLV